MSGWQPPARSLPTESIAEQIVHVLGFAVVRSIVILVHTNIYSLSFTVGLNTKEKGLLRLINSPFQKLRGDWYE